MDDMSISDYQAALKKYKAEYRKERTAREMAQATLRETQILLELSNGQLANLRQQVRVEKESKESARKMVLLSDSNAEQADPLYIWSK